MTLEILEIKLEMTTNSNLLSGIKEKAKKLGFDDVGFCNASVSSYISKNLVQFVEEGWHGEMHWMKKNLDRRKSPINLWKDAKSAVVVLVNYSNNTIQNCRQNSICTEFTNQSLRDTIGFENFQ